MGRSALNPQGPWTCCRLEWSRCNPSLAEELDGVDFEVRYRGHWGINLHLTPQLLQVRVADSDAAPITVGVNGEVVELPPGSMREFPL
jgi:trehalose/maltose hydrolase-like predicted phosphorylase